MLRRVVVTGIGAITPVGHGREGLWSGVISGTSGVKRISGFDTSGIRTKVGGEIVDFDPRDFFEAKQVRRMDRFAQFALSATEMALVDAGLHHHQGRSSPDVGVTLGTALGGVAGAEKQHEIYLKKGLRGVDPSLALIVFGGAGTSNIAIRYGFTGPSNANSNSCSSGTIAVGEAFRYVREGYAEAMICGGAEAPLFGLTFGAFAVIRAMTSNQNPETASRPFDRERDGFVMAEGAAILVLEELRRAQTRGAKIYCEVLGYSCNNDAYHMVQPRPDTASASRAMKSALQQARIHPEDIGYINAHGSSTPLNDKTETRAIKRVFGEHAGRVAISSTKSMHAHSLGAAGAIEAAICAQIFDAGMLPPTINLSNADPECDLDYVPNQARPVQVDYILSNSFGFGGINSALVLGRFEE